MTLRLNDVQHALLLLLTEVMQQKKTHVMHTALLRLAREELSRHKELLYALRKARGGHKLPPGIWKALGITDPAAEE